MITQHPKGLDEAFWIEITRGLNPTYTETHKFGTYEAVGTSFVPIARGGVYATPIAATALEVVSTSANDDGSPAGTHAHEVTIIGLDSSWAEVSQTVTLNGTTPVALGTNLIRAYRMYVSISGTYATQAAGSHEGAITLQESGAGPAWLQIYATDFPRGQSQCAVYTVPTGKTAVIIPHYISVDSNKSADIVFFQRPLADDVTTPFTGIMRAGFELVGVSGLATLEDSSAPLGPYVGPCDVGFMGKVSGTTGSISANFEIVLYDTV